MVCGELPQALEGRDRWWWFKRCFVVGVGQVLPQEGSGYVCMVVVVDWELALPQKPDAERLGVRVGTDWK